SFMFFDVLRRYLTHLGLRVTYVQNVTAIDDRSIAAAKESGGSWNDIVESYYASFKRSMDRLHVLDPDHEPRATRFVSEIVAMIGGLIERGNAYVVEDGVYFAVRSFPRYGALSGRNVDELLIGARIAPDEKKRDPLDFALWKFVKPDEPSWPSPWGAGRPGWHIECSAMSHALLGEPFDIHGGGYDLVFPHHENEIAQTESICGPPMANVWMHGGLLQFDGRKMSKSLGNFEPLATLLDRHDPQAIRLLFLQAGYRKPLNFTEDSIVGATTGLRRLQAAYDALRMAPADGNSSATDVKLERQRERFFAALDDDLNTAGAVSVLFELANGAGEAIARGSGSAAAAFLHEALTLLGLSPHERARVAVAHPTTEVATTGDGLTGLKIVGPSDAETLLPSDTVARLRDLVPEHSVHLNGHSKAGAVVAVIEARLRAKQQRDFDLADALRKALLAVGVTVVDRKEGASWTVAI
ncbi:MAG: cysteine--tRNA ligase, partial [Candidatus Eremiobacteraeota bacterium]|nr:cysteine--tRNA ligase [Candidatus Eremiobacteraeota bacterium]